MVVIPDRARQRNDFRIIQLARPGSSVRSIATASTSLRGDHGWLVGDRREALREFAELVG